MKLLQVRNLDELQELIDGYRKEQEELIEHITSLQWHMRGGITREDAWAMSYLERKIALRFIEERVKMVEKTGMPIL